MDLRAGTSLPPQPLPPADETLVPAWFHAFTAVPNVRFTRTPDSLRRRKPEDGAEDDGAAEALPEAPRPVPAPPVGAQRPRPVSRPIVGPRGPVRMPTVEAVPPAVEATLPAGTLTASHPIVEPAAPAVEAPVVPVERPFHGMAPIGPVSPIGLRPSVAEAAVAETFQPSVQPAPIAVRPRTVTVRPAVAPMPLTQQPPTTGPAPMSARGSRQAVPAVPPPEPARPEAAAPTGPVVLADTELLGLAGLPPIRATARFTWPAFMPAVDETGVAAEPAFEWAEPAQAVTIVGTDQAVAPWDEVPAFSAGVPAIDGDAAPVGPAVPSYGGALQVPVGLEGEGYELPPLALLTDPPNQEPSFDVSAEFLDKNSLLLQQTLHDFGVRGEIIDASPGPVVTLYELEPAPGTKSSRVISLSSDISRSMSAVSARVAVVEGRNVIGIELPNARRETVWLRELLASQEFAEARAKLGICLGKTIGGSPVIADLARMPHLLVAGTTGSGKSVAINTMILSLLYRHRPSECRLIMIDPKMLELSVYEGIPHLLTPVVTDPRKAVVALKWAVREMEDRYKKMSRLAVRNIDGFNQRMIEARARHAALMAAGREDEAETFAAEMEGMTPLPFIVVIVDEMADLMMVAGKDIEGAIQRLAQMARAAGIHLIMATQRPSVDVITGTIKANFPTRISFQVTSKIDSRTILGEMGAEQLLGQGDMLYMAGGGRIVRVHGPFVSDQEVEKVVQHLKLQGRPEYLDAVTASDEMAPAAPSAPKGGDAPVMDAGDFAFVPEEAGGDLYAQAVALVLRDRKASTSYVQRRLQIGYNRAASLMEQMETEGIVGQANHAGKREIFGIGQSSRDDED
ncbi:DNA translocase FtsK [Mongoliimonas terrestris]|uniref:DNA translocase FtsK n=1 Tax=Mongoliimonas terrestris TaxID=1709001 RepID=UPI001FDA0A2B|nr:DNA translocase FtsK [Mongoliimonas terrestris]